MRSALLPCLLPVFTATLLASPQYSQRKDIATGLTYLNVGCLAIADFNGDAKPDFAVADFRGKNIQVYLNQGNGTFSAPVITQQSDSTLAEGPLVSGDFDEDGKQDLIVSPVGIANGPFVGDAIFYSGNGDGTFTQRSRLPTVSWGFAAAVVDLNQDSHLDLLSGFSPTKVAYGDGRGSFSIQSYLGVSQLPMAFTVGDFNGDSKPEIVASSSSTVSVPGAIVSSVQLLRIPPFGSNFSSVTIDQIIVSPGSLSAVDFNGDGKLDLLIGGQSIAAGVPTSVSVFLGNGDFTFRKISLQRPKSLTAAQAWTASLDVNNDKKPDIVVADAGSNILDIFLNDGTGTFPQTAPDYTAALPPKVAQVGAADFNGDGLPDIIVTNYGNQNVSIFLSQTAPPVFLTSPATSVFTGSSASFNVKVTPASGVTPTGTITLLDGTTTLGQQTLDYSGQATFSISNLTTGQHSLSAAYSGDSNFTTATSAALTQSITDFQIALPSASQTVTAGGTATYSLTVTPAGGLTGSITITCSQLPSLATCDPVTVPITGQPVTATLTVHTTAPVTRSSSTIRAAAFGVLSIALATLLPGRRRRSLQLLAGLIAVTLIGSIAGCSSGTSSATRTPVVVTPGTPQGSTPFTITSTITLGGQTLTRTSTATLAVQ